MATRQEVTGQRSLAFSAWIREQLPDSSTGLCVGNLDWIFWNWKTRTLLLAEEKTHGVNHISGWFSRFIHEILDPALVEYAAKHDILYLGFHLITFENTNPSDGKTHIDGKEISVDELRCLLNGHA